MRGDTDIIAAMATLAYDGRAAAISSRAQLIAALRILQAGDVATPARWSAAGQARWATRNSCDLLPRACGRFRR